MILTLRSVEARSKVRLGADRLQKFALSDPSQGSGQRRAGRKDVCAGDARHFFVCADALAAG